MPNTQDPTSRSRPALEQQLPYGPDDVELGCPGCRRGLGVRLPREIALKVRISCHPCQLGNIQPYIIEL